MMAQWLLVSMVGVMVARSSPPADGATQWPRDYSAGLRLELIENDLVEASAVYRRVMSSSAPPLWRQRAQFRLATVLSQLGRTHEARRLFSALCDDVHTDESVRRVTRQCLEAFISHDSETPEQLRVRLRDALATGNLDELSRAASDLAGCSDPAGLEHLKAGYEGMAASDRQQRVLLEAMGDSEWPAALPTLRSALSRNSAQVKAGAALALGRIGDAASVDALIVLVDSSDTTVRQRSAEALGLLRAVAATDALTRLATREPDGPVRRAALESLHRIGTAQALRAVSELTGEPESECRCLLSPWYRRHRSDRAVGQLSFAFDDARKRAGPAHARPPTVGVVVSAMTHHGPSWASDSIQPYSRQIRKAWVLQRAGFDVCLLVETEVPADPEARSLCELLRPVVRMHPVGRWPACDAIIMDQLYCVPLSLIRTVDAYCRTGGRLVVCGAVGGVRCDDSATWRNVLGVRRPHTHRFRDDAVALRWRPGQPASPGVLGGTTEWVARRAGSCFLHEILDGDVLAEFANPSIWAIKRHRPGRGEVVCMNWDVGMNVDGAHDEDELLCRVMDVLLDENVARNDAEPAGGSLCFDTMRHLRWGRLARAKHCVDGASLLMLNRAEATEVVAQLYRLYELENNAMAGLSRCAPLLEAIGKEVSLLDRLRRTPRRIKIATSVDNEVLWWRDVPGWLIPTGDLPLWLSGPKTLPATVWLRVHVAEEPSGGPALVLRCRGAKLVSPSTSRTFPGAGSDWTEYRIDCDSSQVSAGWVELQFVMDEWNAYVCTMTSERE